MTLERTKFNVDQRNVDKRTFDGIVFDSEMEMKFYRDVVLPQMGSGDLIGYELQKAYELQPKFTRDNKTILPIIYVADFCLKYPDGREEVVDVKGHADTTARMKRKLFWYRYPDIPYRWVTYVKKYGGWCDWDVVNQLRSAARREKKKRDEKESSDEQEG